MVAILYAVFTAMSKTPNGRRKIDSALLTMPVIGNVQSKSAIARFARTFGTLVTSGVPILQALTITKDTAGNMIVGDAIGLIHDSVKEGESVVTPMSSSAFPAHGNLHGGRGEETGQLPDMLLKIADVYDDEVDNAVGAMTSMLEPIMIVFLAVVVGGIVFAMFLPLLQVIEKMG
ncbi:MAG: type II secretion system F family protein [Akkermansia sp.]